MAELADTQDLGDDTSVKESFDMKKFMAISFLILICVIFGACGDVSNVEIHNETSKIFLKMRRAAGACYVSYDEYFHLKSSFYHGRTVKIIGLSSLL